ncbi:MAG: efflux RND transporter periplasmic adaptor subunit [Hyphomicrobiaceae bacterium]|nr:efflux RND transporter periplasmic adaptor subunit [Hyphomicrobiaceae bacterium]
MTLLPKLILLAVLLIPGQAVCQTVVEFTFPGRVEPRQRVQVANQISGIVESIHIEAGQRVTRGDLMYSLDDASYRIDVANAEAAVAEARARLALAEDVSSRQAQLQQRGVGAAASAAQSALEVNIAKAGLAKAEAQLQSAGLALERTRVHAPISGLAQRPKVAPGAFVEAKGGTVLGEIVQNDPVLVAYRVSYADRQKALSASGQSSVAELCKSVQLSLELQAGDTYPETGRALFESAELDTTTGLLTVWGEFPNPFGILIPGMEVSVVSKISR